MSIGSLLKEERKKNKLSQEDVAKAIGSTKQAIYKYENGIVTNIPMDKIEIMAKLFGVTPSYLMGWDAPMERNDKKNSSTSGELSDVERLLIDLFRQIPDDQQKAFLEIGRVYANSLKKD